MRYCSIVPVANWVILEIVMLSEAFQFNRYQDEGGVIVGLTGVQGDVMMRKFCE